MQRTIRAAVAATALAALAASPAAAVTAADAPSSDPGSVAPSDAPGSLDPAAPEPDVEPDPDVEPEVEPDVEPEPDVEAEPEPEVEPAQVLPGHIAVLGDSISAGTGATGGGEGGWPGETRRANSWATGDSDGLDSVFQRLAVARAEPTVATNLAQNGARADDLLDQLAASPADVETFQVQIGGNDLCRPTVEEMTPTAEYRGHLDDALAWIAAERPGASVQLNSVPDIYRLWEIRRSNFVAVLFWASGVIPCQSLLASPTSTSPENMARREAVRARGLEYNQQLREACEAHVTCRYDDDAAWTFSNDPARFVDADISTQDHFHPSFSGQRKLADVAWGAGFGGAEAWWLPTPDVEEVPADAVPDDAVPDDGAVDDGAIDDGAIDDGAVGVEDGGEPDAPADAPAPDGGGADEDEDEASLDVALAASPG